MSKIAFILLLTLSFLGAGAQTGIQYKITVAQDDSGDFTTIQQAIDATKAFPPERITIFVKNGTYKEKVRIPSWNNKLSLIGEDADKTIIVWDDYFDKINRGRNSTFFTYTLKVEADDFYAENLTISNDAGPVGQAVALHVEGNRCRFKNCKILGNQDSAYLDGENSNQLFENCTISGTTDFIFGSATVIFKACTIISKKDSYITAASTTKEKAFGFVFFDCQLEAEEGVNEVYLGRPWRPYAKTVFINCNLGAHICTDGWKEWSNKEDKSTTFYAEYNSSGPGTNTNRVEWAHQLTRKEVAEYTIKNILGEWTTKSDE
ncbi:pectinesterase family protein [Draconibacterium sp. IB214405]|uniref:pectinesterase family protein n=1 Tax=Draconibacterium sp. IB214405 TaxID=3097352 RepID=UPI002A179C57|nr:pectinesterase family protein [Draconibacterium sp. IB214405]MDX8338922.1 pectinesterase family protein [Draconibacterium sp. IB214405]